MSPPGEGSGLRDASEDVCLDIEDVEFEMEESEGTVEWVPDEIVSILG